MVVQFLHFCLSFGLSGFKSRKEYPKTVSWKKLSTRREFTNATSMEEFQSVVLAVTHCSVFRKIVTNLIFLHFWSVSFQRQGTRFLFFFICVSTVVGCRLRQDGCFEVNRFQKGKKPVLISSYNILGPDWLMCGDRVTNFNCQKRAAKRKV